MRISKFFMTMITALMVIAVFPWLARAAGSDANADLTSIHQGAGALSPAFSPSVTEYWVKMRSSEQGFYTSAIPADSGAKMAYSMNGSAWITLPENTSTGYIATNRGENKFQFKVTSADSSTIKTYTIHVYFPSTNDVDLSDLRISGTTLSPPFAPSTTSYTASTVPYATSSVSLTGVLDDPAASFVVNGTLGSDGTPFGPIPLNVGSNTITVRTTSYDGTANKTYTITVMRAEPGTNAELSALTVSGNTLSPPFQPYLMGYVLADVSYATREMTVTPTAADSAATVQLQVNDGGFTTVSSGLPSQPFALNVGGNRIQVKVVAEDGMTTNTYTMTVKRKNNNAWLSGLDVAPGTLNEPFAQDRQTYTMADVPYATSSLTVTPTLSDPNATVYVRANGGSFMLAASGSPAILPLTVGSNTLEIKVLAEDPSEEKIYTLAVTRLKNSDASLSALTVSPGYLDFSSQVTDYSLTVSRSVPSLTVKPVLPDSNPVAKIQVRVNGGSYVPVQSGTDSPALPLVSGVQNVIEVLVTAQDGTTRVYTIRVSQAGTPVLTKLVMDGMKVRLTFSEPLQSVADATYFSVTNMSRSAALSVTDLVYTPGAAEAGFTASGPLQPGDDLEFRIQAGAVSSLSGETNAAVSLKVVYGDPIQQMQRRLADLDTDHDGIGIREVLAYLNSPYGHNDLNGDGQFTREDVAIVLKQVGAKFVSPQQS
ncbi:cadherin-like beta sandwich domain-containing protein [Paenibacillus oleatilyticus]|uniref:cadherin-like beta sandwich domain-containing protein n=1 Tax=Paenibacillus oleatilyticus TaxID=2594886 RepID=UPI001C1FDEAB|nr:cadherin-like beta sandwich domain-containing protein [Paenibacillus oleatilyticus]MBU7319960.1 cadherin-like beta sandwich domain-containing protein [Paenibacillus oleatilyticus]